MNTYFNQQNITKRFFYIVGNTKDTFVDESLAALDLETVLFQHFSKLGYERIMFYSKAQKIYCYDDTSYQLVINPTVDVKKKTTLSKIKGPLGGLALSALKQEQEVTPESATGVLHFSAMNDMDAFQRIDACMKEKSHKTAVVFTNAEDFIAFFGTVRTDQGSESIRPIITDSINSYAGLGFDNSNIMLFIFPQRSYVKTIEVYDDLYGGRSDIWGTHFSNQLKEHTNVIEINAPSAAEIRNAINYLRIYKNLRVQFNELDDICKLLARMMYANKEPLSSLMAKLYALTVSNTLLNLKQCEIICGVSNRTSALTKLNELIGMQSVKAQVNAFIKRSELQKTSAATHFISRIEPQPASIGSGVNMHFAITGNPGTGKTTVAKLLGEILFDIGFLSSGHTVKVTASDLIAGYRGQSAIQTRGFIEQAMGGVLFIDEAYSLVSADKGDNDFGAAVITTILEAMSNYNGHFSVIVAGYPKEMGLFINSNPGLQRRFNNTINIPDYEPDELLQIFKYTLDKRGIVVDAATDMAMLPFFTNWFRSRAEGWGNAGNVENLIDQMFENWCVRSGTRTASGEPVLLLEDIPTELQVHNKPIEEAKKDSIEALNNLIGLQSVKERIADLRRNMYFEGATAPGHYIFAGNPGTGKTTVARLLGDIFCSIGVLRRGHVVEVNRDDLVSEHVGGTAPKTRAVIEKALDGILFIDEAYSLFEGNKEHNYGKEALDTLVAAMENNRDRLCVICAGYLAPMSDFMNSNVGFKSRFNDPIIFEDYSADEMVLILRKFSGNAFILTSEYEEASRKVFEMWTNNKHPDFGNGRDVRKYFDDSKSALFKRLEATYGLLNIPEADKNVLTGNDISEKYKRIAVSQTIPDRADLSVSSLPGDVANEAADALILISAKTLGGRGYGSGFIMTLDGYAITCHHVIAGATEIKVRIRISGRIGGRDTWHNAKVIAADKDVDMALLKLEGSNFPCMRMSAVGIHRGDEIKLLGYPFGDRISDSADDLDYSVFEGKIASIQTKHGYDTAFVDMQAKRGNSGGPVLNAQTNEVVGILCGSQIEGDERLREEINYIRPIKYVQELFFQGGTK